MVDYFNALDSEAYGAHDNKDLGLGVQDIGMSVPLGISAQNVSGVYSKIRMGAGNIELGFPGAFSGQRNAQTPGMYGADQRQALREMAEINDVKFTVHGAYNVMGMTGQDQQGNIALTSGERSQNEILRAIEFAADVAGGGSVVVHSGEFERPITHLYLDGHMLDDNGKEKRNYAKDENGRLMFKKRLTEPWDFAFQVFDPRTGQVHDAVAKGDRFVAQPVWLRSKKSQPYKDAHGKTVNPGDYIDEEGNLIEDPFGIKFEYSNDKNRKFEGGRVPELDPKTGRYKVKYFHFDDFERESLEYNKYFEKVMGRKPEYYEKLSGQEMFLRGQMTTQAMNARGWSMYYGQDIEQNIEALKRLRRIRKQYEKLDANTPPEEKWKILKQDQKLFHITGGIIPPENKDPLEYIDEQIKHVQKGIEFAKGSSSSQEEQAWDILHTMHGLRSGEKVFNRHFRRLYAELGIEAMKKTKDPNNPIVLTVENIFPERYGGHPEELKFMIKQIREKMVEYLTEPKHIFAEAKDTMKREDETIQDWGERTVKQEQPYYIPGMTKEEAAKLAEKHIKITLDTGHLNLWKKFWQDDPKKTREENDAMFKKWYLEQVESLAKDGLIGNVHLTDNYGYQDDHIAPGQGNVPIREVIQILKKYGYDDAWTVEPGADASTDLSDFHGLMKTWNYFGSPIFDVSGMGGGITPQRWGEVQYSYFGQTRPPYYVFGPYAPSNEWTMWSATPME